MYIFVKCLIITVLCQEKLVEAFGIFNGLQLCMLFFFLYQGTQLQLDCINLILTVRETEMKLSLFHSPLGYSPSLSCALLVVGMKERLLGKVSGNESNKKRT